MSEDKLDPRLEQLLSDQEPYLDDAGFTMSVMATLPPPRPKVVNQLRQRMLVFGIAGVAGSVCTALFARETLQDLAPYLSPSLAGIAPVAAVLLAGAAGLLVALYPLAETMGRCLALRATRR